MAIKNDVTKLNHSRRLREIKGALDRLAADPEAQKESYLVGENGPEIMVPDSDGVIVPNAKPVTKKALVLDRMAKSAGVKNRLEGGPEEVGPKEQTTWEYLTTPRGNTPSWDRDPQSVPETPHDPLGDIARKFSRTPGTEIAKGVGGVVGDTVAASLMPIKIVGSTIGTTAGRAVDATEKYGPSFMEGLTGEKPTSVVEKIAAAEPSSSQIGRRRDIESRPEYNTNNPAVNGSAPLEGSALGNKDVDTIGKLFQHDGNSGAPLGMRREVESRPGYTQDDLDKKTELDSITSQMAPGAKYAGGGLATDSTPLKNSTNTGKIKIDEANAKINAQNAEPMQKYIASKLDAWAKNEGTKSVDRRTLADYSAKIDENGARYDAAVEKADAIKAASVANVAAEQAAEQNKVLLEKSKAYQDRQSGFLKDILGKQLPGQPETDSDTAEYLSHEQAGGQVMRDPKTGAMGMGDGNHFQSFGSVKEQERKLAKIQAFRLKRAKEQDERAK